MKFGGRNVSPDENGVFKNDGQVGSVEICDTGFGNHGITSEERKERSEGTETEIEATNKDTERLEFELHGVKLKFN